MSAMTDIKVKCPVCNWIGTAIDCKPSDDGSPCCPLCLCNVIILSVEIEKE